MGHHGARVRYPWRTRGRMKHVRMKLLALAAIAFASRVAAATPPQSPLPIIAKPVGAETYRRRMRAILTPQALRILDLVPDAIGALRIDSSPPTSTRHAEDIHLVVPKGSWPSWRPSTLTLDASLHEDRLLLKDDWIPEFGSWRAQRGAWREHVLLACLTRHTDADLAETALAMAGEQGCASWIVPALMSSIANVRGRRSDTDRWAAAALERIGAVEEPAFVARCARLAFAAGDHERAVQLARRAVAGFDRAEAGLERRGTQEHLERIMVAEPLPGPADAPLEALLTRASADITAKLAPGGVGEHDSSSARIIKALRGGTMLFGNEKIDDGCYLLSFGPELAEGDATLDFAFLGDPAPFAHAPSKLEVRLCTAAREIVASVAVYKCGRIGVQDIRGHADTCAWMSDVIGSTITVRVIWSKGQAIVRVNGRCVGRLAIPDGPCCLLVQQASCRVEYKRLRLARLTDAKPDDDQIADTLVALGRDAEAETLLRRVVAQRKEDRDMRLANLLARRGRHADAAAVVRAHHRGMAEPAAEMLALRQEMRSTDAARASAATRAAVAMLHRDAAGKASGIASLDAALDLFWRGCTKDVLAVYASPADIDQRVVLAYALFRTGDFARAAAEAEQVLAADLHLLWRLRITMLARYAATLAGNEPPPAPKLRRVVEKESIPWIDLLALDLQEGRIDDAEAVRRAAYLPDGDCIHFHRGAIALQRGRVDEARAAFRLAAEGPGKELDRSAARDLLAWLESQPKDRLAALAHPAPLKPRTKPAPKAGDKPKPGDKPKGAEDF